MRFGRRWPDAVRRVRAEGVVPEHRLHFFAVVPSAPPSGRARVQVLLFVAGVFGGGVADVVRLIVAGVLDKYPVARELGVLLRVLRPEPVPVALSARRPPLLLTRTVPVVAAAPSPVQPPSVNVLLEAALLLLLQVVKALA